MSTFKWAHIDIGRLQVIWWGWRYWKGREEVAAILHLLAPWTQTDICLLLSQSDL